MTLTITSIQTWQMTPAEHHAKRMGLLQELRIACEAAEAWSPPGTVRDAAKALHDMVCRVLTMHGEVTVDW